MTQLHRITVDPNVCGGRPAIRGLRIRVKDILDMLAAGASREQILADYPYLEADDIVAALQFAATQSDHPYYAELDALPGRCPAAAGAGEMAHRPMACRRTRLRAWLRARRRR